MIISKGGDEMRFKICGKYQRIHKRVAQRLYNNGHTIVVCAGNELNSNNSIKISVFNSAGDFDTIVSAFKDFQRTTENNKKYITYWIERNDLK